MHRRTTYLVVAVVFAVLLAGCGGDKDTNKSSSDNLPQQVSYLDGAVSFRLPEGWLSVPTDDSPQEAFVILNNPALMDEFEDTEDIADSAANAFNFAYDPTYNLEESYLTTKENVVLGVVAATTMEALGEDMAPKEVIQLFFDQGKLNLQDSLDYQQENGRTEPVYDQTVYDLDQSKIETFKNGALMRFKSAGNLPGMLGVVRAGENLVAVILATDKPDQYMDTFEDIIRSVQISEEPLPVVTEEVEEVQIPTIAPTITPMPTQTPVIIVVTATPVPTAVIEIPCTYAIQEGDVPSSIAEHFGLTLTDVLSVNPTLLDDWNQLNVGDEIKLPGPGCD